MIPLQSTTQNNKTMNELSALQIGSMVTIGVALLGMLIFITVAEHKRKDW